MAKQIAGLCRFVGTIDDLTFYKMDGQYYVRAKSSLTAEQVKKKACFRRTMQSANRMVRASHIGAVIYKALPPRWRQFWMYRGFTGEAFVLLKNTSHTEAEITQILWKCYVEYWEQRKAARPDESIWLNKEVKLRKRRKYSEETLQRRRAAMDLQLRKVEAQERRRIEREKKQALLNARVETAGDINVKGDGINPPSRPASAIFSQWQVNIAGKLTNSKMPVIFVRRPTGISNFVRQQHLAAIVSECCDSS